MSGHFTIAVDPSIDLVRIAIGGFFAETEIAAFCLALEFRMQALHCALNAHVTLCDVTAMKIQSQAIVTCFAGVVGDPRFRSRRLAFVTGSSLARMQTRRLTTRAGVEYFGNDTHALAWLLAPEDSAQDNPQAA